ncbi:MAG: site-specific DNA-methyltransferase [Bacteroidetes bacterium]|nr:site-specific DNA-methyltransferase [Bacteroidota bacterium]
MNVIVRKSKIPDSLPDFFIWHGKVEKFLKTLEKTFPNEKIFDLVISSPPYNIGKEYETVITQEEYIEWQKHVIKRFLPFVKNTGAICWQVGSHVENNVLTPLDSLFIPVFQENNLKLRNRIIWHFGHGLHETKRLSGRYEVLLWYTKTNKYIFNLDDIRIPQKYPGKRAYKGPKKGEYSGNYRGKNPTDVLVIPNVNSNHSEKTIHPCQFPIGLVEFCIEAFTNPGATIFDPFMGVGSAGAASALFNRKFIGCELKKDYIDIAIKRINLANTNDLKYRPWKKPLYDPKQSQLSKKPSSFK